MAVRLLTSLEAQCFDGHHIFAMQRYQAMCRAHKVDAGPTRHFAIGFQLIGHDLWNGQLGQTFIQGFLQTLQQVGTLGHAVVKQSLCFAIGRALQRSH